jgi:zinc transport system ATP-binding protein
MTLIQCKGLSVGYDGRPVAKHLTFSVEEGDYLVIIGENGAGKSTLMRTLLGLIPPVEGEMSRIGIKPNEIGYLPQQTSIQKDFPASVLEIVRTGLQGRTGLRPFYRKQERKKADQILALLRIEHLAGKSYRTLSGGQQQRVLLARALLAGRELLLLDEPVTGLDPEAAADMYRLVEHLNRDNKIGIIMISHDVQQSLSSATHVLHVGQKSFFGTAEEYAHSPRGSRFLTDQKGGWR